MNKVKFPSCLFQPVYRSNENEDLAKGTAFMQVVARDADAPGTIHSRITYSLEGLNAEMFAIDPSSGVYSSFFMSQLYKMIIFTSLSECTIQPVLVSYMLENRMYLKRGV